MNKTHKSLFIIIFSLFIQTTFGQNKEVDIDKLETKEDVELFIHSLDKTYEKFELKSIAEFNGNYIDVDFCRRISDSLEITDSFYKSDFDKNGLTDLLLIGDYYDFNILVVMNYGKDSLKVNRLTRRISRDCVFPKIVNDTIIDLYYRTQPNWNSKEKFGVEKKSLTFKFGDFIELNENPTKNNIEKIEFKTSVCFGSCPSFQMIINQDITAVFIAEIYNRETRKSEEIIGKFKTVLKEKSYTEIIDLLNYINFPELKESYSVNWTDDQTSNLKITYDNGKVKEISDYGLIGTYGLDRLYELFFELRFNQNWE